MSHNITPLDEFTTAITVPDDGDQGFASVFEAFVQALANRTENNKSRIDPIDALALTARVSSDEWVYPSAKARTVFYDASACSHASGWSPNATNAGLTSTGATAYARLPLNFLPDGATIGNIRVLVDPNGVGAMATALQRQQATLATPAVAALTNVATASSSGTAIQLVDYVTTGNETVDKASGKSLSVLVTSAQAGDVFYGIEVTFSELGPRNF